MQKVIQVVTRLFLVSMFSLWVVGSFSCVKTNLLTTDKAKDIIIKHFNYPQPAPARVRFGSKISMPFQKPDMKAFVEEGLITSEQVDTFGLQYNVSLTDEGKKYALNAIDAEGYVDIKLAEKAFVEVTSVRPSKDSKEATVTYTWKYNTITPFGKYWKREFKAEQINENELHTTEIHMALRNHEWIIDRVL